MLCSSTYGEPPVCLKKTPESVINRSKEQNLSPVTLQGTLEKTYMQNATLDAARAGLRVQNENVSQANAEWRPSLGVTGQDKYEKNINNHPSSDLRGNTIGYTAVVTQNVYKGGGTVANIEVKENETFAEKAGLFSQEQTILFKAVAAHTNVIAQQDIVKYQKENVSFTKTILEQTQAQFEVGDKSRTDVEAALANYEGAKGNLSTAIGELEAAKAEYVQVVASSPENLAPAILLLDLPETYEDALEVAKNNNPDITQARFALEAAQYNVDLQISPLLPTLDIQGSVGTNRRTGTAFPNNPSQTALTAQADLGVPIYQQGIPNSKIRQAYQQVAQQKVSLVQVQRNVEQATRTAWENHIAKREALKGFLAQVKAGEIAVEGAMEEVKVGAMSIVDVLFLQQDLISAQIALVQAQAEVITTAYAVLQAMGSLMARTLKLNVRYYDPDAYYNEYKDAWIQFWQGEDWRYVRDEPCGPICK